MKTSTPAPDPQIGAASKEQVDLATKEYNDQKALTDQYSPLFASEIQKSVAAQDQQTQQSADTYANYKQYFQPVMDQYATQAADYATDGRKEQAAQTASGQVATAYDAARAQQADQLTSGGVQAGSGKALALNNALNLQEATAKAGAANTARTNVENTGLSLEANAANIGNGLPTTSLQQGAAAQSSGSAAQGSVGGLSGLTAAPLTTSSATMTAGINGLLGYAGAQQNAATSNQGFFGDLIGAGLKGYGMYSSSKGLKSKISRVDGKAAVRGLVAANDDGPAGRGLMAGATRETVKSKPGGSPLQVDGPRALKGLTDGKMPVDGWKYHDGVEDSGDHVGPYAEDVHAAFGDAVAPGGRAVDIGAMSHVNGAAIAELSKKVLALSRELKSLEAA